MSELPHIGRANLALLFHQGGEPTGVISTVVATATWEPRENRIRFPGPGTFDQKAADHIRETLLPTADRILQSLGLPHPCFDFSLVNLGAASIHDVALSVGGYSADLAVLAAILAASLDMAVPEDMAFTGHLASVDGDIRMVSGLPVKLEAAITAGSITTFVHPSPDASLSALSPEEESDIRGAINRAKRVISTLPVRDINELIRIVFSDEQVVMSSLKKGFYKKPFGRSASKRPMQKAISYLTRNHEQRFWKALQRQFIEGRNEDATEALESLIALFLKRERYPKLVGTRLVRTLQSLPPAIRRFKVQFPLLPIAACIKLSQFARGIQHEDTIHLLNAVSGKGFRYTLPPVAPTESYQAPDAQDSLDVILAEIGAEALSRIGTPIDAARACYPLDSVTVAGFDDFNETITSYYIHLMQHTGKALGLPNPAEAGADAIELLERTFARRGGLNEAFSEARTAVNGGLRLIFDLMTEEYKRGEKEKRVNLVLKSALDPLDWEGKVALMDELLKRLKPQLPGELLSHPAARFANHYSEVVRLYVQSMDQIKTLFRSL
ncbi:MAG: hypothetical protein C4582_00655 [Desulfobacteraceae bacterium]|nr:MAG: hypothetical protein C4582_00655 [Desulfobacteraceae bacterium]